MRVTLEHTALLQGRSAAARIVDAVDRESRRASASSPVGLPSLAVLPSKTAWLSDQLPLLDELAALALLLDTEPGTAGAVTLDVPGDAWDPATWLHEAADRRFGPGFAAATGLTGPDLTRLLLTLGSVGQDLPAGSSMTAEELRRFVIDHPAVAAALRLNRPFGSGPAGTLHGLTQPFMTSPGGASAVWDQRRLQARDLFAGLSPDDAAILAMTYPTVVGGLGGVPFAQRAQANTVNVVAALADERSHLDELRVQHERHQHDWDLFGLNNDDLEGPIADSERRIALYESILTNDRQILVFDPAGDGAIAELHGPITARTGNVGVMVPGTGSDLSNFGDTAARSLEFQETDPSSGLTMITWMGGDLPDSVLKDAPFANYSVDLGPRLADFSRDLALELDRSPAPDAKVTVAGHSYGGAVVGRAELSGLVTDRVLHIESAGMGHDIDDPGDLPASAQGVERYSMTAPGDIIGDIQGLQAGDNIGHGADPDTFDGTVRLDTGNKVDGSLNTGAQSHSGVFEAHSDAWQNMYEVFTGGTVQTYRSPDYYVPPPGPYGGVSVPVQVGWKDDGERVDIE